MWKPHKKTLDFIEQIKTVLGDRVLSLREIYYAMEARQMIKGGFDDYTRIKNVLIKARKHFLIHPEKIKSDVGRKKWSNPFYAFTAKDVVRMARRSGNMYDRDSWLDQPKYIEVWVEKISLCDYFLPYCQEYGVILQPCRGDQAISTIWDAKKRFDAKLTKDKKCKVLYFGDFNPSGLHAPTAILNTLALWGTTEVEFDRVMLTYEDIKKYNLPENPTKKTTKKDRTLANRLIKEYGEDLNVEMDSLKENNEPEFLKRIEESIKAEVDLEMKEITDKINAKVRKRLNNILQEKIVWD